MDATGGGEANVVQFPRTWAGEMRQIVSFGGGGFSMESGNTLLDDYVLSLTGEERPRVCFVPTASGDADHYIVRFYRAFSPERCEPSHLSLFRRDRGGEDLREFLLSQDLIYVGGGSVISMLGAWRAHGVDTILREVYGAEAALWHRRWRLFFLATSGLFSHAGGTAWGVSHYRLAPTRG